MKISTVILLLLMSTVANAQNYKGMNEADMQKIQKMQSCMEDVDQEQLKALEQRQYQFDAEIKSLCDSGKRDEAQEKAILFEKEMTNNLAIQAVNKCGEIAEGIMDEDASNQHVCDSN